MRQHTHNATSPATWITITALLLATGLLHPAAAQAAEQLTYVDLVNRLTAPSSPAAGFRSITTREPKSHRNENWQQSDPRSGGRVQRVVRPCGFQAIE